MPFNQLLKGILPCIFCLLCLHITTAFAKEIKKQQTVSAETVEPACRDALLSMLPWERETVEIKKITFSPQAVQLPEGQVEISITAPYKQKPLGRIILNIELETGGVKKLMRAHTWVEVYKDVVTITVPMAKGHIIRQQDIQMIKMPLSHVNGVYLNSPEDAEGLAVKQNLKPGQVLTTAMVTLPIIVRKGAIVNIMAESQNISIATKGEARQDGAKGDVIKVKNLMSNKEVTAKVFDSRTVTAIF